MKLVIIHQGLDSGGHTVDRLVLVLQHVQVAVDLVLSFSLLRRWIVLLENSTAINSSYFRQWSRLWLPFISIWYS
jgi:hypothetical protein